jgi:DNA helicase HerA-like ATPase
MSRKIAAEGRKFGIGLVTITQRPAQVSKYVLAQMNTQAMFRTVNSSDLSAISTYVEYTGGETVSLLPQLTVGQAVFSGLGVPFPAVVG